MGDKEIIEQLKKGNQSSLKHVYKHSGMVKNWILKNNGNEEDAKDVFQDAVFTFYKKVKEGNFQLTSKISTYLFSICKNAWLNQLNRRKRHERTGEDENVIMMNNKTESFEVEVENDVPSLKSYLNAALEKLGEPCKSLIEATVYFKRSMKEIAKEFGYSTEQSARQQKLRCLKRLRGDLPYDLIIRLV